MVAEKVDAGGQMMAWERVKSASSCRVRFPTHWMRGEEMARPTNDKKDTKIILRTNAETREYVERKAAEMGCSISDCVRKLILDSSNVVQNTDSEEIAVLQNNWDLPEEIMNDTESMGGYFGMTLAEMMIEFNRILNDGDISCENGKLYSVLPNWAQEMSDACHDANIPVEKAAEKFIGMIQRGQI